MSLAHYIIVRRDLPLGVITAMVTHAAGESAALYEDLYDGRFRGAIAVVLEAKNEAALEKAAKFVFEQGLTYVLVEERTGPYANQLMAIGIAPGWKKDLEPIFKEFQLLKPTCSCSNCTLDNGEGDV